MCSSFIVHRFTQIQWNDKNINFEDEQLSARISHAIQYIYRMRESEKLHHFKHFALSYSSSVLLFCRRLNDCLWIMRLSTLIGRDWLLAKHSTRWKNCAQMSKTFVVVFVCDFMRASTSLTTRMSFKFNFRLLFFLHLVNSSDTLLRFKRNQIKTSFVRIQCAKRLSFIQMANGPFCVTNKQITWRGSGCRNVEWNIQRQRKENAQEWKR